MINCIHVISDTNIGGAGRTLLGLLGDGAWQCAVRTSVAVPEGSRLVGELRGFPDVCVVELPGMEDSAAPRAVAGLYALFRKQRPNIVHTHASLAARLAARLAGVPVVHTRHTAVQLPTPTATGFTGKMIRGLVNNTLSDHIISVSPAATQNLLAMGAKPDRISLVYNGVAPSPRMDDVQKQAFRLRYGIGQEFVASVAARLSPEKGHVWLLEAAKILLGRAPHIRIAIAGDGALEETLREHILREGLANVSLLGFIKDVWKLQNISDIQLNTSIGAEATSLALLEGLSLGLPAVVSDSCGNPYVIRDGVSGLVVSAGDASALADAILRLYSDAGLYARLSEGASLEYESRFRVERVVGETLAVYNKILGGSTDG